MSEPITVKDAERALRESAELMKSLPKKPDLVRAIREFQDAALAWGVSFADAVRMWRRG